MIEFIFLDLDDTILDFRWAERRAIGRVFTDLGIEPTEEVCDLYRQINLECWCKLERQEITREQLQVSRFCQLQQVLEFQGDPVAVADTYVEYLSQGHCFLPGAEQTMKYLAEHYRLFLATNGLSQVQHGRLKSAGLTETFEKLFISQEIGLYKPHVEYFEYCFSQIPGFQKERAIMVGDSLFSDIRGGINAGITTCWVNPQQRPEYDGIHPDYQIETLPQLLPILEKL